MTIKYNTNATTSKMELQRALQMWILKLQLHQLLQLASLRYLKYSVQQLAFSTHPVQFLLGLESLNPCFFHGLAKKNVVLCNLDKIVCQRRNM